jgi:drug/metabolite transporter (DMT)-like permease
VPFIAVLMGAAFLAEAIEPAQIVGGAVIIIGVAITRSFDVNALALRLLGRGAP